MQNYDNDSAQTWKFLLGITVAGWIPLIYLIYAQGITAFNYDIGVAMGTLEPIEKIIEIVAAFIPHHVSGAHWPFAGETIGGNMDSSGIGYNRVLAYRLSRCLAEARGASG